MSRYGLIIRCRLGTDEWSGSSDSNMLKWYLMTVCLVTVVTICLICCHSNSAGDLQLVYQPVSIRNLRSVQQISKPARQSMPRTGWRKNGILYELPEYNISILTAVGRNRSFQEWDEIVLNGWEGRKYFYKKVYCCFQYISTKNTRVVVADKNPWLQCKRVLYTATQFTCHNPGKQNGSLPVGVYMTSENNSCDSRSNEAISIHYPKRQSQTSIAVCAKIAYGSISPRLLTEWYEIQKHLRINKVVTFAFNLSNSARAVLGHYEHKGFLDVLSYVFPHKEFPRRSVGDKTAQVFNDEQVVAFDCAERLSGYQYVGMLDHDEFIIPSQAAVHTWKQLLTLFLRRKPNASGFVFRTELFVTDWGTVDNSSQLIVGQYRNRTRPMWDRQKAIYMPRRVVYGSVWTHNYTSLPGYEKYYVPAGLATIKHYRPCRQEWLDNNNCFTRTRFKDHQMIRVVERLNRSDFHS